MTGYGKKGLAVSLAFHAACIVALLYLGGLASNKETIVIDFRLGNYERHATQKAGPEEKPFKKPVKKIAKEVSPPVEEKKLEPALMEDAQPLSDKEAVDARPVQEEAVPNEEAGKIEDKANAGASMDTVGEPSENDVDEYLRVNFSFISDAVQRGLVYPRAARQMGWMGRVVVSFKILRTGHVKDLEVTESSGFELLDKNAVETIKRLAPFPSSPVEARLVVPIIYALK